MKIFNKGQILIHLGIFDVQKRQGTQIIYNFPEIIIIF